jgi:hypothetical protein
MVKGRTDRWDGVRVGEHRYRIVVSGRMREVVREAFADLKIEVGATCTALVGDLDQSALYGALHRTQSLGLELLEVRQVAAGD